MLKPTAVTGIAVFVQGCATVASGPYGVSVDQPKPTTAATAATTQSGSPLRISAGELTDLASSYFGVVEVTFENRSPVWIQIDSATLDFGTPAKNRSVAIPQGADIEGWERAVLQRSSVSASGDLAARELMGLARPNVWNPAGDPRASTVGALVALDNQKSCEPAGASDDGERFPSTHLMALPFRIPPGLFAKRWVLLYTADRPLGGCIDSVTLDYRTSAGSGDRVLLHFKNAPSEWQRASCGAPL